MIHRRSQSEASGKIYRTIILSIILSTFLPQNNDFVGAEEEIVRKGFKMNGYEIQNAARCNQLEWV